MNEKVINVATDYSTTPAGRFVVDGPYSGQRFRDEFLYPALQQYDQVQINLNGTLGYGSSFLEEAFGGLIRERGLTLAQIKSKIQIISSRRLYKERVWQYLEDAEQVRNS